jgi:DNA-binding transcriptional MerR regulator
MRCTTFLKMILLRSLASPRLRLKALHKRCKKFAIEITGVYRLNMALLTQRELKRLEKIYSCGISSLVVVEAFRQKGERFSEATLRKYVQLGLLPKSRRVGARGRHRGSSGRYPIQILRMINDIKELLESGATLEEIRIGHLGPRGGVDSLEQATDELCTRFIEAIDLQSDRKQRTQMRQRLRVHQRALQRETKKLSRFAEKLGDISILDEVAN